MKTIGMTAPATLSKKMGSLPKLSAKNMGSKSLGVKATPIMNLKAGKLGAPSLGKAEKAVTQIRARRG